MSTPDDKHRLGMFELLKKQRLENVRLQEKKRLEDEDELKRKQSLSMPSFYVQPPRPQAGETDEQFKKRMKLMEDDFNNFRKDLPERLKDTCRIENGTFIFTSAETVAEYLKKNPNTEFKGICNDKSGMLRLIKDAKEHGFLNNVKAISFTDINGAEKLLEGASLQKMIDSVLGIKKPRPPGEQRY